MLRNRLSFSCLGLPAAPGTHRLLRRDGCVNARVVMRRIRVPPPVVILLRNFPGAQLGGLFLPGAETLIKISRPHTTVSDFRAEADCAIDILYAQQLAILQREQRVHQAIHRVDVRNRDTVALQVEDRKAGNHYGVELQRDLAMAISEYAPGSQVVANGRLFTSRYIKKMPSIGWKMYDYVSCESCQSLNIEVSIERQENEQLKACRICGCALKAEAQKTFLELLLHCKF